MQMKTENKETQTVQENKSTEKLTQNTKTYEKSYEFSLCSLSRIFYNIFKGFSNFMSCRTLYLKEQTKCSEQLTYKDPNVTLDTEDVMYVQDWLNVPNPKN